MFTKMTLAIFLMFLSATPCFAQDFTNIEGALSCSVLGTTKVTETESTIDLNDNKFVEFSAQGVKVPVGEIETLSKDFSWAFDFKKHQVVIKAGFSMDSRNRLDSSDKTYVTRSASVATKISVDDQKLNSSTNSTSFKGMELYSEVLWDTVTSLSQTLKVSGTESLIVTCAVLYKNPNYSDQ